jgi:hypothetical protein
MEKVRDLALKCPSVMCPLIADDKKEKFHTYQKKEANLEQKKPPELIASSLINSQSDSFFLVQRKIRFDIVLFLRF